MHSAGAAVDVDEFLKKGRKHMEMLHPFMCLELILPINFNALRAAGSL